MNILMMEKEGRTGGWVGDEPIAPQNDIVSCRAVHHLITLGLACMISKNDKAELEGPGRRTKNKPNILSLLQENKKNKICPTKSVVV